MLTVRATFFSISLCNIKNIMHCESNYIKKTERVYIVKEFIVFYPVYKILQNTLNAQV